MGRFSEAARHLGYCNDELEDFINLDELLDEGNDSMAETLYQKIKQRYPNATQRVNDYLEGQDSVLFNAINKKIGIKI